MSIQYLGLNAIQGPMVVLEGVQGAAYDEIVEMTTGNGQKKAGQDYRDQRRPCHDSGICRHRRTYPAGCPDPINRTSYGAGCFGGNVRQNL